MGGGRQSTSHQQGFTLLEISIVLIIFSVMVGSGFAIANRQDEQKKRAITTEHLDKIEEALMAYRSGNNRLPCPADASMNPDNAQYGIEAANPDPNTGTCTGGSPAANFTEAQHIQKTNPVTSAPIKTRVVGGMVPVATLGLPKKYALDGYGNKISYHIDAQATEKLAFTYYTASNGKCFNVVIDDEKTWTTDADKNYISFHAVYALVSHGKDGHGAFSQGGARVNKSSTNTFQNANGFMDSAGASTTYTSLFFLLPESESSTTPTNRFDDVLRFKTRADLRTEQDSPGYDFPDVTVTTTYSGAATHEIYFYYRCKDRFIQEQSSMVDDTGKRVEEVAFSPNNEFILSSTSNDGFFKVRTYDGNKTSLLPDSAFTPYFPGAYTGRTVSWSTDGSFFIVTGFNDAASLTGCTNGAYPLPTNNICSRIRVYEKTGYRSFTGKTGAVPNYRYADGVNSIFFDNSYVHTLSPDNNQLLVVPNGITRRRPVLYKRNADNTFTPQPNAFDPPLDALITSRKPIWSPNGKYLVIPGNDPQNDANNFITPLLYRYDGDYHYSLIFTFPSGQDYWYSTAFNPTSRMLVKTSPNGRMWHYMLDQNDTWTFQAHSKRIGSVFDGNPDPRFVVCGGVYNYGSALAFSPDGRYLALGLSRRPTGCPVLYFFKVDGDRLIQLESPDGVDISPMDKHVQSIVWRKLMPWEQ